MSKLLEKAFEEARKLPEAEQDGLAAIILNELEDEQRWDQQFAASHDVLRKLAEGALDEYRAGKTLPLDPDRI